jgi:hypothetical protein
MHAPYATPQRNRCPLFVTFGIIRRSAYMPSGSTKDEAFPRRFHHLPCHLSQGIDLDKAGNLRQQTMGRV